MGEGLTKGKHIANGKSAGSVIRGSHGNHAAHAVFDNGALNQHASRGRRIAALSGGAFARFAVTGCVALAVGCFGFGLASAGNVAGVEGSSATDASGAMQTTFAKSDVNTSGESFILEESASRDMGAIVTQVQEEEEQAKVKAAEEEKAKQEAIIKKTQESQATASSTSAGPSIGNVDFTVGKEAFIAEWTKRIDDYLAGSNLAGYGATFAEAAWNNGVDPRWSPAISNTESGKGANCFAAHNAWGWSGFSWPDWETAINAHVAGLASVYGHTISYANAKKYCPPNYDYWYRTTLSEMSKI